MSTHNIGFYEEISKISLYYHQISSNTHLISSAGLSQRKYQEACEILKKAAEMFKGICAD